MKLFESQIKKKQHERVRKQAEQANIRKYIGADVSDDTIQVNTPAVKTGGELAVGVIKALSLTVLRIVVFALCAAGLIALIYPGPRRELTLIMVQVLEQLRDLIGIA